MRSPVVEGGMEMWAKSEIWSALLCLVLGLPIGQTGCSGQKRSTQTRDATPSLTDGSVCCAGDSGVSRLTDATCCSVDSSLDGGHETDGAREATLADATLENYCFAAWPPVDVGGVQPALAGATPGVIWTKKIASLVGGQAKQLVMSNDAVALTVGNSLVIVNKDSGEVTTFSSSGSEIFGDVVVTTDGRFLLGGRNIYAVGGEGRTIWSVALSGRSPIGDEWSQCRLLYSNSWELLIAICNDGVMYGVSTGGQPGVLWQTPLYVDGMFDVYPAPSIGGVALAWFAERHEPAGNWVIDPLSGRRIGLEASTAVLGLLSSRGFIMQSPLALLDECGQSRWRGSQDQLPMVLGLPDERVFVTDGMQLAMVSVVDGGRLAGPTATGTPIAAGADGTFYAVTCDNRGLGGADANVAPDLVAYTGGLEEKWRVTLPVPAVLNKYYRCPRPGIALDNNGVMYLAVEADGTYLIAVQTPSPGVAPTAWPLRFRGHNGSLWLD